MEIILSGKKNPKRPIGAIVAVFAIGVIAVAVLFFVLRKEKIPSAPPLSETEATYQRELESLAADMGRLRMLQDMAEDMHDPVKYASVVEEVARKQMRADEILEAWQKEEGSAAARKGLQDGLQQGIFEVWQRPFAAEEKLGMLAAKYGLPVDRLKLLRAEIEVMFADEMADKWGSAAQEGPETPEPSEDENVPSAGGSIDRGVRGG